MGTAETAVRRAPHQVGLADRALEGAGRLVGSVNADDDAFDGREFLARGVARHHDDRALGVRGQRRGDGTEETIRKATASTRADDDHVNFGGEVDEDTGGIARLRGSGHVRGAAFACHRLRFFDDLLGARFEGFVVEDGVSAVEGGG